MIFFGTTNLTKSRDQEVDDADERIDCPKTPIFYSYFEQNRLCEMKYKSAFWGEDIDDSLFWCAENEKMF